MDRIKNLQSKLTYLKRIDKKFKVFGSYKHMYKTDQVNEKEIERIERYYEITFPKDFKSFLINIGTGAGPEYGIFSFEKMINQFKEWNSYFDSDSKLSNECLFKNDDAKELIKKKKKNPKEFYFKKLNSVNGILPIHTEGCTYYSYLILNGEQRGKMWSLDTNEFDTLPSGATSELTFIEWYERWLDESIKKVESLKSNNLSWLNPINLLKRL